MTDSRFLRFALLLVAFLSNSAVAQSGAVRPQREPNFLVTAVGLEAPMIVDASSVPILKKRISLSLARVTVEDALRALASR